MITRFQPLKSALTAKSLPQMQPLVDIPIGKVRKDIDFRMVRLDSSNVCRNKRNIRKEGKEEGERLFQGMLALLRDNFPPSEIENEAQYRRYFFDKNGADWFVNVALSDSGEVVGAILFSYSRDQNLVMSNLIAVRKDYRRRALAKELVSDMISASNAAAKESHQRDISYILAEIEKPDSSVTGEEGEMRNVIRPAFHDEISRIRAIRLQGGSPLIYLLPIMATDAERQDATDRGEPLEPEPLMFCLRPVERDESDGISSKEAGRLLVWFYKDYLEAECSDAKRTEVNELLAVTLSSLAPGEKAETFKKLLDGGRRNNGKIMDLIPEHQLSFMKVSEAGI